MHWVFTQVEEAIKVINADFVVNEETGNLVQQAINNYDTELAEKLINEFNLKLPKSYASRSNIRQKEEKV